MLRVILTATSNSCMGMTVPPSVISMSVTGMPAAQSVGQVRDISCGSQNESWSHGQSIGQLSGLSLLLQIPFGVQPQSSGQVLSSPSSQ